MSRKLIRLPEVLARCGVSRSTYYHQVADGTQVPPVLIGERAAAYPSDEVDAVTAARVAGRSRDELRALVHRLVAQRAQADAHLRPAGIEAEAA